MKITITIETGNAAFDPDPAAEVARILSGYAEAIKDKGLIIPSHLLDPLTLVFPMEDCTRLRDINGNTVGKVQVEREGEEAKS